MGTPWRCARVGGHACARARLEHAVDGMPARLNGMRELDVLHRWSCAARVVPLAAGRWFNPPTLQVQNPATGEVIARVSHCKGPETQAAIAEAASVAKSWAAKTGRERGIILKKCVAMGAGAGGRGGIEEGTSGRCVFRLCSVLGCCLNLGSVRWGVIKDSRMT